jgi:integrase
MAKPPKLDHVRYVTSKGRVYAYFNTGRKKNGRPEYIALPRPGSVGFFDSYAASLAGRNRKVLPAYTVATLFDEFQDSQEFAALARGTQEAYGIYLRLASELLGKAFVDDLTRADVLMILDNEKWGAGKRNLFVAVIGAAYKWGRLRGRTAIWPTREIPHAETGEHLAWPDDVRDAGLEAVDDLTRLAVALLFYTGQRIGDVCAMRWTAIKNEKIKVVQQKTGKSLMIRLHADLRAELDRYGKRGLTLLTNALGGPVSPAQLRRILKAFCASLGHPELKPHGLRKNAVIALLTAGCSVAETAAITGQTYQLVEYYARQIDQERMGEAAILKMERAGNKQTAAQTSSGRGRKA